MEKRRPVRVSLGCHVQGASLPVPDLNHGPSILAGCTKRVAAEMPPINRATLRRFKRFTRRFLERYCSSLRFSAEEEFSFDEWIDNVKYPQVRKDELRRVYQQGLTQKANTKVKSFVKNEPYEEPKHLRGIYSRHDDYKCRVGPYFKKFGDKLFALKWFIKKISKPDHPQVITDRLSKFAKYFCTDFSQFEATFVRQLLSIEQYVYRWTLEGHPLQKEICDLIAMSCSQNKISFKDFDIVLDCKRMSGEMNTSCGNGLMNLLITAFVLQSAGNSMEEWDAYFEGDDGIIGCKNLPTDRIYTELGARVKITVPSGLHTASFCGNVFDPEIKHNVTNPMEASVSFGWTTAEYAQASVKLRKELLRAKSYSMLYQYPGCPILKHLALYGLRMTEDVAASTIEKLPSLAVEKNSYVYEKNLELQDILTSNSNLPIYEIHDRTRFLVAEIYGISVNKQIEIEKYLDNLGTLQELRLDLPYPKSWFTYDFNYTTEVRDKREIASVYFNLTGFETSFYTSPGVVQTVRH